eukprot:1366930-Amorphochlora_amoeboformis.AAC.3
MGWRLGALWGVRWALGELGALDMAYVRVRAVKGRELGQSWRFQICDTSGDRRWSTVWFERDYRTRLMGSLKRGKFDYVGEPYFLE